MDVRTEKQAVIDPVLAFLSDWSNVGGFERRKSFFLRHSTATLISIRHENPEGALTKALSNQRWIAPRHLTVADLELDCRAGLSSHLYGVP